MVTVSQRLLDMMDTTNSSERPVFRERAKITFSDDTTIELDSGQFSASENTITDAAGASSFPLGVAVSKGIQLNISNAEDEETGEQPFAGYYFYGARIHLWIEVDLTDGSAEIIEVGWFTVTSPEEYGSTISVTAFDDMYRADRPFDADAFGASTEISLLNATQKICSKVGIPYSQSGFKNSSKTVSVSLFTESQITYRQALGYIAMLAGGNARLNRNGSLEILSYSAEKELPSSKNTLNSWTELSMDTEDITLTGISIDGHIEKTITNEDGEIETEEVETTFHNTGYTDGYAISLENPLMEGREQEFLDAIWNVIGNISFRKFEGDHIENPLIEFMDEVYIVDRKGNYHYSIITDITYTFYGATNIKNSAESAARISSSYGNPNTSTEKKLSKMIYAERSARETAIKNLKESLAQTGDGVFTYSAVQSDGSEILYLYNVKSDKTPPYQDSTVIIKITGSALGISHGLKDGGDPTNDDDYNFDTGYNFATDTAILNALYANGIDADRITIRNLSLSDIGGTGSLVTTATLDANNKEISANISAVQKTAEAAKSTAEAKLSAGDISLSVTNSGSKASISLKAGDKTSTANVIITGFVTFSNIKDGKTVINGNNILTGNILGRNIVLTNSTSQDIFSIQNIKNSKYSYIKIYPNEMSFRGISRSSKKVKHTEIICGTDEDGNLKSDKTAYVVEAGTYNVHSNITISNSIIQFRTNYVNTSSGKSAYSTSIRIDDNRGILIYNSNPLDSSSKGIYFADSNEYYGKKTGNKTLKIVNGTAYLKSIYLPSKYSSGKSFLMLNASTGKIEELQYSGLSKKITYISNIKKYKNGIRWYSKQLGFKNGILVSC